MGSTCITVTVAEVLRRLQTVPDPHEVFGHLDTQYSKFSNTNYTACEWEFPIIQQTISERKSQIGDLDIIIQRVEIILDRFRQEREKRMVSARMHEGFLSCIRRLPSEILKEIFTHCLPLVTPQEPSVQAAPLLLTRICRAWREIALNTPSIWSSLVVKGPKEHLSCYDAWLRKAKSFPLSLKVDISSQTTQEWTEAALDFLQPYVGRLRNLAVDFNDLDCLSQLFSDAPMLEYLCLSGDMEISDDTEDQAVLISQPQPYLRTLIIHSPTFDSYNVATFNPGWLNLTNLALVLGDSQSEVTDPIFLSLLQTCSNLEHLIFSPVRVFFDNDSVSFTHPKLRELDIADVDWDSLLPLTLTLPNLRDLHLRDKPIQYDGFSAEDIVIPRPTLPEEKSHRILKMTIEPYVDFDTDEFFLNPGWTALTHITLNVNSFEDVFFRVLALCPNLEDLVISSMDVDIDTCKYNSSSRFSTSHPVLRSLDINVSEGVSRELLDIVTFPSLRHLEFSLPFHEEWPHASFKEFLSRSKCPLETLVIEGKTMPLEQREEFGLLIPSLTSLDLWDLWDEDTDGPVYKWSR